MLWLSSEKANPLKIKSECQILCLDRNNATCYNWKSCNVRSCKKSWRRHRPRCKTKDVTCSVCRACVDHVCRAYGACVEHMEHLVLKKFPWKLETTHFFRGTQEVGHKEHNKVGLLEAQVTFRFIAEPTSHTSKCLDMTCIEMIKDIYRCILYNIVYTYLYTCHTISYIHI